MRAAKAAKTRVLIATTEGPVAVQKITAEDPDVPSVACLDGTTTVLGVSDDYARFVNKGTGLVAALTGHAAYRMDLDGRVDSGRSWQLPVLLAHLLAAEDKLAAPDERATLTILATGEVDRDQRVRSVRGMDEKIKQAGPLLAERREGEHLLVVVPKGNAPVDGLPESVRLLAWERFEGLAALGAEAEERLALPVSSKPPPKGRGKLKQSVWLTVAALAALAVGGTLAWQAATDEWETMRRDGDYMALDAALEQAWRPASTLYSAVLKAQAPPAQTLTVGATELRTADGGSCTGRRFSRCRPGGRAARRSQPRLLPHRAPPRPMRDALPRYQPKRRGSLRVSRVDAGARGRERNGKSAGNNPCGRAAARRDDGDSPCPAAARGRRQPAGHRRAQSIAPTTQNRCNDHVGQRRATAGPRHQPAARPWRDASHCQPCRVVSKAREGDRTGHGVKVRQRQTRRERNVRRVRSGGLGA